MRFKGGYNLPIAGRPEGRIEILPEPNVLYLPLKSERFSFSQLCVSDGQEVRQGEKLAQDPDNFSLPLLAPRSGTVRLNSMAGHIVVENPHREIEPQAGADINSNSCEGENSMTLEEKSRRLIELGAWGFFRDAHTRALPDPFATPKAIIVSTLRLDPFAARGDVQIFYRMDSFLRGLKHLQTLLEYQRMYLIVPKIASSFARKMLDSIRGHAWIKLVKVPLRYPFDNFALLARRLGLQRGEVSPVWAIDTAGVLAVDRALTSSKPSTVRIISLGGPAVKSPVHLKAMAGYPIKDILDGRITGSSYRVIDGGLLTGRAFDTDDDTNDTDDDIDDTEQEGLGLECDGITVLEESTSREFLSFVRPGWDRKSFSRCFISSLRGKSVENLNTSLRGELRPCVGCGLCEKVCPARIMPHLLHKYVYSDALENLQRARIDLCIECGLCSYVCPSKIDLRSQFIKAKEAIVREVEA